MPKNIKKPARKIAANAGKPAAAAKPVKPALHNLSKADARVAADTAIAAFYAAGRKLYSGPSNVIHTRKPGKLDAYIARVKQPVQSADVASPRDEALLAIIHRNNVNGTFDPCAIAADLGVISRLASLGYVTMRGDKLALSTTGAERAAIVAKRA